ncbi:MAG: 50S ribosomal protein L6 [Tenericutes bacterium GWC2_39_45]|nr:MAG: 50S ribosomal protein L6 [Tenericutes bacterium GWA2_38_26]OHE30775.1 MAG: 50S ribosomal protein L6 [Tenericutes bacterium GWC2_39_45]OHE31755.1 MAG: 50S ribosomal protein L6 [Tenericutes bacterium GWD2_38_27]OHE40720.1 MAG: 50S ribosomal protein L6 [Tenericutes bacterium GWF2_38_8]HBG33615.1 50S ribosomal protein L6 [Acholeplasmataceae bacterium]
MSRIGNKVIQVPAGVTVTLSPENYAVVKGPKGQLEFQFNQSLDIKMEGADITISRPNNEIFTRKIHGTTRALLANMIIGVSTGFKKQLEIRGVGYRASLTGNVVNLSLGYSHPIELEIPAGLKVTIPKNTDVIVEGADKQLVGEFSAKIRSFRKPEPYLGKGIRYVDEYVPRKAGKTAK